MAYIPGGPWGEPADTAVEDVGEAMDRPQNAGMGSLTDGPPPLASLGMPRENGFGHLEGRRWDEFHRDLRR